MSAPLQFLTSPEIGPGNCDVHGLGLEDSRAAVKSIAARERSADPAAAVTVRMCSACRRGLVAASVVDPGADSPSSSAGEAAP